MWAYDQSTGKVYAAGGFLLAVGYSGFGADKDVPAAEVFADLGPIPEGIYSIAAPVNTAEHGPYVLRLSPAEGTNTYGRSAFLIHGDSIEHPGQASHGCIILPRLAREQIWESGDHQIKVVAAFNVEQVQDAAVGVN